MTTTFIESDQYNGKLLLSSQKGTSELAETDFSGASRRLDWYICPRKPIL